ncbi:distal tail protein Dit [Cytobacillus horneckiae]|uniref:distal tail protein Dit n=1 Tax=Cytobacillus horneckiae TaxID=549687 RepID=UPI003D9A9230
MYRFVDTVPTGEPQGALLSLQTIFNGINLDELLTDDNGRFVTISVGGRGILERRLMTRDAPYQNGLKEKGFTYDVREIPVKFLIEDKTSHGLRERFNTLNAYLLGSKKRIEFTDEDAYFIATLKGGDVPDEDSNSLEGILHFVCTDPAKYKKTDYINLTNEFFDHIVTGQVQTPWSSRTVFKEDAQSYTFENDQGGKVLCNFGFLQNDILEIDYQKRKVSLNGIAKPAILSMQSNWFELKPGINRLRASQDTTITYVERYY